MTEETEAKMGTTKRRYLSDEQCKQSAVRISAEMREDREGREKWGDQWKVAIPIGDGVCTLGKKPPNLIFPGDFDAAKAMIEHLYHPAEAELIIKSLTP